MTRPTTGSVINRTVSFSDRKPILRNSDLLSSSRQYFLSLSSSLREPVKISASRSLLSISPARKVNSSCESLPSSTFPSSSSYSSINISRVRPPISQHVVQKIQEHRVGISAVELRHAYPCCL